MRVGQFRPRPCGQAKERNFFPLEGAFWCRTANIGYQRHLLLCFHGVQDAGRQGLRRTAELAGESLREIGVLLVVFVPLDAVFYQGQLTLRTRVILGVTALAGLAIVAAGIWLERGSE